MATRTSQALLLILLAASAALAAPSPFPPSQLQRRAVINHDAVVGFPETVPDGVEGALYLKYKPYLDVVNGCVPYPAVDADGNTSGGLKPTGGTSSGCSSSPGQIYARATSYTPSPSPSLFSSSPPPTTTKTYWAIMYTWYMPKDSPSPPIGHRHDWEHCIVFLASPPYPDTTTSPSSGSSGPSSTPTPSLDWPLAGMAVSAHAWYSTSATPPVSGGTHPLVGYKSTWPLDHRLVFADAVGGEQPLVAWESLPTSARDALQWTDWGSANVPVGEWFFERNVKRAAGRLGL